MKGISDPQPAMAYHLKLARFVLPDHAMRQIRPLIDTWRTRQLYEPIF